MGCDIHFKLERRVKDITKPICYHLDYETDELKEIFSNDISWQSFDKHPTCAEYLDRNYLMFSAMADVRSFYGEEEQFKRREPKGFPEDASFYTILSYGMIVNDEFAGKDTYDLTFITKEQADYFQENYYCKEIKLPENTPSYSPFAKSKVLTHPDYHSASWMTTEEFEECFKQVFVRKNKNGEEVKLQYYFDFYKLLLTMQTLEEDGLYEVRIIFWFDN